MLVEALKRVQVGSVAYAAGTQFDAAIDVTLELVDRGLVKQIYSSDDDATNLLTVGQGEKFSTIASAIAALPPLEETSLYSTGTLTVNVRERLVTLSGGTFPAAAKAQELYLKVSGAYIPCRYVSTTELELLHDWQMTDKTNISTVNGTVTGGTQNYILTNATYPIAGLAAGQKVMVSYAATSGGNRFEIMTLDSTPQQDSGGSARLNFTATMAKTHNNADNIVPATNTVSSWELVWVKRRAIYIRSGHYNESFTAPKFCDLVGMGAVTVWHDTLACMYLNGVVGRATYEHISFVSSEPPSSLGAVNTVVHSAHAYNDVLFNRCRLISIGDSIDAWYSANGWNANSDINGSMGKAVFRSCRFEGNFDTAWVPQWTYYEFYDCDFFVTRNSAATGASFQMGASSIYSMVEVRRIIMDGNRFHIIVESGGAPTWYGIILNAASVGPAAYRGAIINNTVFWYNRKSGAAHYFLRIGINAAAFEECSLHVDNNVAYMVHQNGGSGTLGMVSCAADFGLKIGNGNKQLDGTLVLFNCGTSEQVSAHTGLTLSAGGDTALPATPAGYMEISVGGNVRYVPYYGV